MIEQPTRIPIDSSVLFRFNANLQFRSDPLRIQLHKSSHEYEPDNMISLGPIVVERFGPNFQAIPTSPGYYRSDRDRNRSEIAYSQSVLDMKTITNNGEKSRTYARNPNNIVSFMFTVFALNFNENIGRNVSFNMTVFVGRKSFFSNEFNLILEDRIDATGKQQPLMFNSIGTLSNENITNGGIVQLQIQTQFQNRIEWKKLNFIDFSIEIENISPLSPIIPCAARIKPEKKSKKRKFSNENNDDEIAVDADADDIHDELNNRFVFNFGRLNLLKLIQTDRHQQHQHQIDSDLDLNVEITLKVPWNQSYQSNGPYHFLAKVANGFITESVNIERNYLMIIDLDRTTPFADNISNKINADTTDDRGGGGSEADHSSKKSITFETISSVKWNEMIIDGGVSYDIKLRFPIDQNENFHDLKIRLQKDWIESDRSSSSSKITDLNVCRFEVVKVSQSFPCTCMERETINRKQIHYETINNLDSDGKIATIDFGSINSIANTSSSEEEPKIWVNFVAMIHSKRADPLWKVINSLYPLRIDLISKDQTLNTKIIYLNVSDIFSSNVYSEIENMMIVMDAKLMNGFEQSIKPGHSVQIRINLLTSPNSMGPLRLEVISLNESLVSICGLVLNRIGHNLPCIGSNDHHHRASYEFKEYGLNKRAKIEFEMITNFGNNIRKARALELQDNTLEFVSMIRIGNEAFNDQKIQIKLTYGFRNRTQMKELIIPVESSKRLLSKNKIDSIAPASLESSFSSERANQNVQWIEMPKSIALKAFHFDRNRNNETIVVAEKTVNYNNWIQFDVPKLFHFDIGLKRNAQTELSLELVEPRKNLKICNAAIVHRGRHYPCYSPYEMKVKENSFLLGHICHTDLHFRNFLPKNSNKSDLYELDDSSKLTDDQLRLAFALKFNQPKQEQIIQNQLKQSNRIESLMIRTNLLLNDKILKDDKLQLNLWIDSNADRIQYPIEKGVAIQIRTSSLSSFSSTNDNSSIEFKIRQRKWIHLDLGIPIFYTGQLRMNVEGENEDNRAFLVLYDLRIVSGGKNIPCALDNVPKFKLRSNLTASMNQTNRLEADLGWFSNFGYSHRFNRSLDQDKVHPDDQIGIEILTELTDHPKLSKNRKLKLLIETEFSNQTYSIRTQNIAFIKCIELGSATKPKLEVRIENPKRTAVVDRNETIALMAIIKHHPQSNAEPKNSILRLYTPNFIEMIKINSANIPVLPELKFIERGSSDIMFPLILFNQELLVNFTIQIDPDNLRGYGRDEMMITIPFRIICEHNRLKSSSRIFCSEMNHFNLRTKSSGIVS
ncbi:hypothetical protein QR98_0077190 [Sarcoptes scabiei]|uniref:Uncharacterized protein n=1 Tax=Sarcoptes scabiei TaxID=52283 RepID=A0A132ADW4_SARSC|nr:hypothetical protein QR98_0077190 [Sarcoptes scabiei]